jgi:hypothetical protein
MLFDNFIGRKRDVDGGVLAGSRRKLGTGRDKLTVTFQTTVSVEPGFFERRETVGRLRGLPELCLELVKWGRETLGVERLRIGRGTLRKRVPQPVDRSVIRSHEAQASST